MHDMKLAIYRSDFEFDCPKILEAGREHAGLAAEDRSAARPKTIGF
jgi:hypothetical protein